MLYCAPVVPAKVSTVRLVHGEVGQLRDSSGVVSVLFVCWLLAAEKLAEFVTLDAALWLHRRDVITGYALAARAHPRTGQRSQDTSPPVP